MSIAILFTNKDPQAWLAALQAKLPSATVEVYPDIANPTTVEFILCWKPETNVLKQFPKVRVVQSIGAGADHILNTQSLDDTITVTRIVDASLTSDLWEYLLAAVLSQLRDFPLYAAQQQKAQWKPKHYRSIKDTTVTILGLGQIGTFAAAQFAALGFRVKGWSASPKTIPQVTAYAGEQELAGALNGADILINLLPLTAATTGILNYKLLKQLNQGAYLINVGRGEHLVEDELTAVLAEGHLSGAMLDVFDTEPLPANHPFWKNPNIRITPHIASLTNIDTVIDQVVANYSNLLKNKPLLNIVSRDKGY